MTGMNFHCHLSDRLVSKAIDEKQVVHVFSSCGLVHIVFVVESQLRKSGSIAYQGNNVKVTTNDKNSMHR